MKKLISLFVCVTVLSCSDSSNNNSTPTATYNKTALIGKWLRIKEEVNNGQNWPLTGCELLYNMEFFTGDKLNIHEYDDNGSGSCHEWGDSPLHNFTMSNNIITYSVPDWGEDGSPLVIKYEILQLSATTLKIKSLYRYNKELANDPQYQDGETYFGVILTKDQWIDTFTKQ